MALKEQIRQIVSGWLIVGSNGPLILSPNKEKVAEIVDALKDKHKESTTTAITVHVDRFKELGRNLIQWKIPDIAKRAGVMRYRNYLVLQTHEKGSWDWVREKNNLPEMTYEEMNQWLMDYMKYVTKEME